MYSSLLRHGKPLSDAARQAAGTSFQTGTAVYQKWVYLNINMCTKVQATIAYFLANKTLNTLLKEQMEISSDPFGKWKKNITAFND